MYAEIGSNDNIQTLPIQIQSLHGILGRQWNLSRAEGRVSPKGPAPDLGEGLNVCYPAHILGH